jgi:hypothetical protein
MGGSKKKGKKRKSKKKQGILATLANTVASFLPGTDRYGTLCLF